MKKTFQQMMENMMSGMMKPGDMPHMMETTMDNVFQQMTAQDRVAFMQNMMPRCMSMMFDALDAGDRKALAEAMLQKMAAELKAQAQA